MVCQPVKTGEVEEDQIGLEKITGSSSPRL